MAPHSDTTLGGSEAHAPPERATVADLVEAQAHRTPGALAVTSSQGALTYEELDAGANHLARQLQGTGVGAGTPVGICAPRTPEMAVGFLAILKAGGACLPLDPSYPPERVAFMLADAGPPALLVEERLVERVPGYGGTVVPLGGDEALSPPAGPPPARLASPDTAAYVIYTSGSTGEPKGVLLPHRGLVNEITAAADVYRLGPDDRVLQFCSIGFDVSVEELFVTWACGGAVVLRPDELPILGAEWLEWLGRQRITAVNLPTAYWHEWVGDLASRGDRLPRSLRLAVVGGEKALGPVYRSWLRVGGDGVRWLNAYGPTETSVMATVYEPPPGRPDPGEGWDPPIGRPIANTTVHLLDERGRPVAPGEVGEVHIGGLGLALGYLNRPELTAERFVDDPFSSSPGARLYRTGDLARLLADGNLEFAGRLDDQVKVRGFRIECGEVESALAAHPGVAEAVVVARETRPGERFLVAYFVPAGQAGAGGRELRGFLSRRLPAYMVPAAFVALDALPLTPNGKVDRDALPTPTPGRRHLPGDWVPPRTPTERSVAAAWSRVLGIEGVGAHDDFFDLGGHSLQATQVVAQLREGFGVDLPVRAMFEAPTVAGLSARLASMGASRGIPPLVGGGRGAAEAPLSLSQEQMWHLETTADPPGLYNITAMHWFSGPVHTEALRRALDHVVERHASLRTRFHAEGRLRQSVAPSGHVALAVSDLGTLPPDHQEGELERRVAEQDSTPFDVGTAPLARAHLYRLGDGRAVLAATLDHLVCDGTSAYIFLSEITAAYDALAQGRTPTLRPLAVQYPEFAAWERRWATEDRLQAQLDYWKSVLRGMPLGPAVPFDRVPERPSRRICSRPVALGRRSYASLRQLAASAHSTVFIVTMAATQAVLSRMGGLTDIVVSTTLSGRQRAELEGLIGCFHRVGRIRTDLAGDPTFEEVLSRARESVLGLFEHQDVPFMRVRQAVAPDFPRGGVALLAAVPVEVQYFHTAHDEWAPGTAVVERPGPDKGPDELYFRGQLHPLNVTFLDDGDQLWGQVSYKADFYDEETIHGLAAGLEAVLGGVTENPRLRLSGLPVPARTTR